jgi:hypothetical protein
VIAFPEFDEERNSGMNSRTQLEIERAAAQVKRLREAESAAWNDLRSLQAAWNDLRSLLRTAYGDHERVTYQELADIVTASGLSMTKARMHQIVSGTRTRSTRPTSLEHG